MADCIFCKIIEKKISSKFVYEDDIVIVLEDINPQSPVHTLIIPKKHIPTMLDLEEEDYQIIAHLFKIANKIAREKGIADRGFRLLTNCNPEGGQIVYHLHFHLMGGRQMRSPFG